jgi:DEAD/DEAH box helicase domain-containing protein
VSLHSAIERLRADPELASGFAWWEVLPARAATFAGWPEPLDRRLIEALAGRGIERPYSHQAEAIELALANTDLVVVTPTASGKTLCYTAPVLDAILKDPSSRALYLFPTKALAQDQLEELHGLIGALGEDVKTFTYGGDTSPKARRAVRVAGHVVMTNPDMLHAGILPNHTKWVRLFENLRYVVIDELHTYRGVFGSHVANLLRRLQRICRFYGSDPTFICCSATIANPDELAAALTGKEMTLVDDNGAPSGERHVALYNPPLVNPELGLRTDALRSAVEVAARLQAERVLSIVFARSRMNVELVTQYLRERAGGEGAPGRANLVRGYRSGYLPRERRAIEAGLRAGNIRTVVATNALELGIDIGGLDASVLAGYPGTLASMWQQMGRAGRRSDASLAVFVAGSRPLDQYVVNHPEYVFGDSVEAGLIGPDNPLVAAQHVQCAAFELPIERREEAALGAGTPAILDVLAETNTVHRAAHPSGDADLTKTYWSSEAYPAEQVSLRQGAEQNVVIIDQGPPPLVIGEVDRPAAMVLVHDEAIYVHDGRQYHVDVLDWEELKAYVRPVDVDYYTDAHVAVDLKVIDEWGIEDEPAVAALRSHGEVSVTYLATIFKKIKLHTHENVGWGRIELPQDDLHTSAFWASLPRALTAGWPSSRIEGALHGLGQLLLNVAPLLLMCDPRDLHLATQVKSPHSGRPTAFLWESIPGGVGFGQRLFDEAGRLLSMARDAVEACECTDGCPGCVGPPSAPGYGVREPVRALLAAMARGAAGPLATAAAATEAAAVAMAAPSSR